MQEKQHVSKRQGRSKPYLETSQPNVSSARQVGLGLYTWGVLCIVLLASLLLVHMLLRSSPVPIDIPTPLTDGMDDQVRRKIEGAHQAVLEDPRSGKAWGELGMVLYVHELEIESVECYKNAATLDPRESRWPYLLAQVLKKRDLEKASEYSSRALELNPAYAPAHVLRAELLEQEGEIDDAITHYKKAIALDARCAVAELGLGRLALLKGELELSHRHLGRASALQNQARSPQAFLAIVYQRQDAVEAAERAAILADQLTAEVFLHDPFVNEVVEKGVSAMGYQRRAGLANAMGNPTKAESLYQTLLTIHPRHVDAHYNLGNLHAQQGRAEAAIRSYQRALEINPEKTEAHFNLGNMFLSKGELSAAENEYRKVLNNWPYHSDSLTNLGNVLVRQGKLGEAAISYKQAVKADPANSIAHHHLGQIRASQQRFAEAISHFQIALNVSASAGPVHFDLAVALANEGNYSGAWKHVTAARTHGIAIPQDFLTFLRGRMPEPKPKAESSRQAQSSS